jgi:hypothetical protein
MPSGKKGVKLVYNSTLEELSEQSPQSQIFEELPEQRPQSQIL